MKVSGTENVICGFLWRDRMPDYDHIHECVIPDEHEQYVNNTHVCHCGERRPCEYNERSYEPVSVIVVADGDEGCPF